MGFWRLNMPKSVGRCKNKKIGQTWRAFDRNVLTFGVSRWHSAFQLVSFHQKRAPFKNKHSHTIRISEQCAFIHMNLPFMTLQRLETNLPSEKCGFVVESWCGWIWSVDLNGYNCISRKKTSSNLMPCESCREKWDDDDDEAIEKRLMMMTRWFESNEWRRDGYRCREKEFVIGQRESEYIYIW